MAMKASGLIDQVKLSKVSGVSTSKLNRILSNRTKTVDAEDAYRLAAACKVSVAWLISGQDDGGEVVRHALLNKTEFDLIQKYKQCDASGQASIRLAADVAMRFSHAHQNLEQ
ncbi:helix-turn-helix domain-containing protein [Undibacterium sp. TJN19]|uniref:helix-turn-helix domain-containing protein n=1 Tax=Undibacterium sp. TJN19 TaxID=3413055 RepID=UPI003BF0128C